MRIATLVMIVALLIIGSTLQAQDSRELPDDVLLAVQTINAQFGTVVDINNVVWDRKSAAPNSAQELIDDCPHIGQPLPPTNANVVIITIRPYWNGVFTGETYKMLLYSDLSFITTCELPPTPTPIPTSAPTRIPPTATLVPTITLTPTPSSCPGVLSSRLVIGQQGRVTLGGSPNNIRAIPGTSGDFLGEIPPGGVFTVIEGPHCFSGFAWWQINYNGIIGWTPESDSESYWLEPMSMIAEPTQAVIATAQPTAIPTVVACNANAPSRLTVGQYAQVTPGLPNNVRAIPGTSGDYLGEIPPGQPFTVVAGPECSSGMAWWQVNFNGLIGWTPEGETADDYWLEPLVLPILVNTIPQLAPSEPLGIGVSENMLIVPQSAFQFMVVDSTSTRDYITIFDAATGARRWQLNTTIPLPATLVPSTSIVSSQPKPFVPLINAESQFLINNSSIEQVLAQETGASITTAAIHNDSGLVAASINGELRVWSLDGTAQILTAATHSSPVTQLAFNPDGSAFVSISTSEMIVWDTTSWSILLMVNDGTGFDSGEIVLGTTFLALGSSTEPSIQLYNYRVPTVAVSTLPITNPLTAMAFSPVDNLLVTADSSSQMQIWDARNGVLLSSAGGGSTIQQIVFSPVGDAIFTVDTNGMLSVWTVSPQ